MKKFKLKNTSIFLLYFIFFVLIEIIFKIITRNPIFDISLLYIIINSLFVASLLSFINTLFENKVNGVLFYISIILTCFLFSVEFCVFKMFSNYFDLSLLGATDQVAGFAGDGLKLILENILGIMLIFFPLIMLVIFKKYIGIRRARSSVSLVYGLLAIIFFFTFLVTLNINKEEEASAYLLYHEVNNIEASIKKFGVMHTFFIDLKRNIFGFDEVINLTNYNIPEEVESEITYKYNNLDIDFDTLIQNESNDTAKKMHEYFKNETGTKQNEYTGYFEGKNLILFMAESFNEIAVDEKRTPTLYKLVNNGFVFNDFYTPTISSTIGGEFQELTGLVATNGFLGPWKSGNNSYPYGIGNVFNNLDYEVNAYHDHYYTFQSRNNYLKALGFNKYMGCLNGLEKKMNCKQWPESDLEMIEATYEDYINSEKPFFTYYVTVSGHGNYDSTAMGSKNRSYVADLPYNNHVKNYLAANVELDKALELLIEKLDEAGKLDDTVIALVGDHYPYYLSTEEVNSVSSYTKDSVVEINHSNFILWNNKMENVYVDKIGSQIDVIPTIYNLFGINYDSRIIIGKDILSTEPGLAIFGNRSWVSDYGTYFSSTGTFVLKSGKEVTDDYVKNMNAIVANKVNMSKLIMEQNYYKYFK